MFAFFPPPERELIEGRAPHHSSDHEKDQVLPLLVFCDLPHAAPL